MNEDWRNELITKGAAFDALTEVESHYEFEDGHDHLMRWAKTKIFALPSEQPQRKPQQNDIQVAATNYVNGFTDGYNEGKRDAQPQQWIPVSERLPKEDTEVIVSCTDDSGDSEFSYTTTGWHYKGIWVVDNERSFFVRAWMPLPDPWKGE